MWYMSKLYKIYIHNTSQLLNGTMMNGQREHINQTQTDKYCMFPLIYVMLALNCSTRVLQTNNYSG